MERREEERVGMALFAGFLRLPRKQQFIVLAILAIVGLGWLMFHGHGASPVHLPGSAGPVTGSTSVTGACADKAPYGAPSQTAAPATGLGQLRQICRLGYLVGYSGVSKTPAWVAEHLQSDAIFGKEPRTNNFMEDDSLPSSERATLADYSRSGYDRGHMAPAADFSRSAKEMAESFYLSNMVPQFPENNRAPWAHLEGHVRSLTKNTKDLYVVTGPVFGAGGKTIGSNHIAVPVQLFKIALDPSNGKLGAWLLPNAEVPGDGWNAYCTSVQAVEAASGLTFFPGLAAEQRNKLISQKCAL